MKKIVATIILLAFASFIIYALGTAIGELFLTEEEKEEMSDVSGAVNETVNFVSDQFTREYSAAPVQQVEKKTEDDAGCTDEMRSEFEAKYDAEYERRQGELWQMVWTRNGLYTDYIDAEKIADAYYYSRYFWDIEDAKVLCMYASITDILEYNWKEYHEEVLVVNDRFEEFKANKK